MSACPPLLGLTRFWPKWSSYFNLAFSGNEGKPILQGEVSHWRWRRPLNQDTGAPLGTYGALCIQIDVKIQNIGKMLYFDWNTFCNMSKASSRVLMHNFSAFLSVYTFVCFENVPIYFWHTWYCIFLKLKLMLKVKFGWLLTVWTIDWIISCIIRPNTTVESNSHLLKYDWWPLGWWHQDNKLTHLSPIKWPQS